MTNYLKRGGGTFFPIAHKSKCLEFASMWIVANKVFNLKKFDNFFFVNGMFLAS